MNDAGKSPQRGNEISADEDKQGEAAGKKIQFKNAGATADPGA
jgi:hypothetical protein